jgi:hypothetical protein
MRAKITMSLGYLVLGAAAMTAFSSINGDNLANILELSVFAAGAMSLALLTRRRAPE